MAKENNPNSNKFKVSPWLVYTAILLIFLGISFVTGGSSFQEPAQLTSSKFNSYLDFHSSIHLSSFQSCKIISQ